MYRRKRERRRDGRQAASKTDKKTGGKPAPKSVPEAVAAVRKEDLMLRAEDIDQLSQALMSLAQEVWVLKDRQRVLEAALEEAGVVAPDAVDSWQPDEDLAKELREKRIEFIDGVLRSLVDSKPQ